MAVLGGKGWWVARNRDREVREARTASAEGTGRKGETDSMGVETLGDKRSAELKQEGNDEKWAAMGTENPVSGLR